MDWNAWAAGLFEGEGWISIRKRATRPYPTMALSSTDEDVVRRFHDVVKVGRVTRVEPQKSHWKPAWKWQTFGVENVRAVADIIGPYLGERRSVRLGEALGCDESQYAWRLTGPHCDLPVAASVAGRQWHLRTETPICERCRISHNRYYNEKRGTQNTETPVQV